MLDVAVTESLRNALQRGMVLRKHTTNGKIHNRVLYLGMGGQRLFLDTRLKNDSDMRQKGLNLDDISEIRPGSNSYNFMLSSSKGSSSSDNDDSASGEKCLSIIGSERTISLEFESTTARNDFLSKYVITLFLIIQQISNISSSLSPSSLIILNSLFNS